MLLKWGALHCQKANPGACWFLYCIFSLLFLVVLSFKMTCFPSCLEKANNPHLKTLRCLRMKYVIPQYGSSVLPREVVGAPSLAVFMAR